MKKTKGFTLIELLAVIVILAIIALIATPIILNMISTAKKAAFKDSVLIASDTIDNYMLENEITQIPEDGITIEDLNNSVLKSDLTSGSFKMIDGKLEAYFVTDGKYCASGKLTNLRIVSADKCYESDTTAPVIDETKIILGSTTNTVTVTIGEGFAEDPESGIREYKIILTGNEETKTITLEKNGSYTFTGLKKDTEYKVEVKAINEALKESELISKNITTKNIDNPTISYTNTPEATQNGYLKQQVAEITYIKGEIQKPEYFVKTSKEGTSSLTTTQSCGTETLPGECKTITSTTTLEKETWYKISGNVNVTYDKESDIGTIYAVTYDGNNLGGTVAGTLDKIDTTSPIVTLGTPSSTTSDITIPIIAKDTESDIGTVTCKYSNTSGNYTSSGTATTSSCTMSGLTDNTTYYYQICVADKVGNTAPCKTGSIATIKKVTTFEYKGSPQTYTTPCNGTYNVELYGAQGGSVAGGKGAKTTGTIKLNKDVDLYLYVGSQPEEVTVGGYNGGGNSPDSDGRRHAGGGATDIRLTTGTWDNFDSLKSRIMIAAGGGGSYYCDTCNTVYGGAGGTLTGVDGVWRIIDGYDYSKNVVARGGTQTAGGAGGIGTHTSGSPGTFAVGGTGGKFLAAGGGGYYGGGASGVNTDLSGSGAGGSSFISGYPGCNAISSSSTSTNIVHTGQANHYSGYVFTNSTMTAGVRSGNGYAKITIQSCTN